jgi:hypothetical protein
MTVLGQRRGPCRLYVDHDPLRVPDVGDAYATNSGQAYLILEVRLVQRGERAGRRSYLLCERMPVADLPGDVWPRLLRWHPRRRRRP